MDILLVIGVVAGGITLFQLGRAFELLREIRIRNDEMESKYPSS